MKRIYYDIKYFFQKFSFLKVYFSPFKFLVPRLYIGKVAIGTPYFLPRTWVKNKQTPKKIGFDFVSLGYKTKWDDLDYRFEWNPVWSFVFFGLQVALKFVPFKQDHYWTCWLVYEKHTDRSKSVRERIKEAKEKFPDVWTGSFGDRKETICYWDVVLKDKYSKF